MHAVRAGFDAVAIELRKYCEKRASPQAETSHADVGLSLAGLLEGIVGVLTLKEHESIKVRCSKSGSTKMLQLYTPFVARTTMNASRLLKKPTS